MMYLDHLISDVFYWKAEQTGKKKKKIYESNSDLLLMHLLVINRCASALPFPG